MRSFKMKFVGREKGAIGKFDYHEANIEAENYEEAVLKLYDNYEHITLKAWV